MDKKEVLTFVGSLDSEFLVELSLTFTRSVKEDELGKYTFRYIMCYPGEKFSQPLDLSDATLEKTEKFPLNHLQNVLKSVTPHVMLMQAFGFRTGTEYKQIFEHMAAPCVFMGPTVEMMRITNDKSLTREKIGCYMSPGLIVTAENRDIDVQLPAVVKIPDIEDSLGVTKCDDKISLVRAINHALDAGDRVVVEKFLCGRELRTAVIEDKYGGLTLLGILQYHVDEDNIRHSKMKTRRIKKQTSDPDKYQVLVNEGNCHFIDIREETETVESVRNVVFKAFKLLELRDWAIFDMREDENRKVHILEVNLFNSFSELGLINKLARNVGISTNELFELGVEKARARMSDECINSSSIEFDV